MNKFVKLGLAAVTAIGIAAPAAAETELTMYYPIAAGGKLTEVVDGIVADFEAENPDIKVNAIYSGNYDDTRVRALSALASGDPAQLAVMFSITTPSTPATKIPLPLSNSPSMIVVFLSQPLMVIEGTFTTTSS